MNFLNQNQVDEIVHNIYDSIGYPPSLRRIFLSSVNSQFRALLPVDSLEMIQLELDIIALNRTARLTDGTIPFESWLEKAARYLKPFPEANRVIQQALSQVSSSSTPIPVNNPQPPSPIAINNIVKEKTVHKNDMVSYAFLEHGVLAGNAVARIKVPRYDNGVARILNNNAAIYLGTGWLLTKDLIITNHHVINARENKEPDSSKTDFDIQAKHTLVQFDFNADNMQGITIAAAKLEASNKELDYAILRLQKPAERTPLMLLTDEILISSGETAVVNIIQHPFGYSKKVALRNNHIYDNQYPHVRYFTDTEGGSSGSPVFNDSWQVIALHRASTLVDNVNYNGQLTAWVNEGVQLQAIFAHLHTNFNSLAQEIEKI